MKRLILTLVVAAAAIMGADAAEKTKTYDFGDIKGIHAGHSYTVYVTKGNSGKVKVIYDDRIESYMEVKYTRSSSTLSLQMDHLPLKYNVGDVASVKVYLEMDKISGINLSGAASVLFEGDFHAEELDIDLSGAANVKGLSVEGESLELDFSGAANADINGDFSDSMELDMSGAANLRFRGNATFLNGEFSGACKFSAEGEYDDCTIECSGASTVKLEGKGRKLYIEGSGACKTDAEKFAVKDAKVYLSGSSKAMVNASGKITHNVSRASKMVYYGDAELTDVGNESNIERGR